MLGTDVGLDVPEVDNDWNVRSSEVKERASSVDNQGCLGTHNIELFPRQRRPGLAIDVENIDIRATRGARLTPREWRGA